MPVLSRGLAAVLYGLLAVFAAICVHNFFAYIDHYPYWSIDDGISILSTSILQIGRYGDPAAPIESLSGGQRYRGFFIYGPWYFLTGSAVTWLFGFSATLLRSLHLLVGVVFIVWGLRAFAGLRGAVASAVLGVGIGFIVTRIQWPMVRPDSFVTLFAVLLLAAGSRAITTGQRRYWFAAGVAAGCGALTHLVGASLIPASALVLLASVAFARRLPRAEGQAQSGWLWPLCALVAGGISSALMFYASFGFRIADHLRHIANYRSAVNATTTAALASTGPVAVWREHFRIATADLPGGWSWLLVLALVGAVCLAVAAWRSREAGSGEAVSLVLPGVIVFGGYAASLAFYPNFHTGYVILPQLFGVWVVASTLYVLLGLGLRRWPSGGRALEVLVAIVVIVMIAQTTRAVSRADQDPRLALARTWISIADYTREVLGTVPESAVAWGAYPFAAAGPKRIQLVSLETALEVIRPLPEQRRLALAPDFLVWGHPQNQQAMIYSMSADKREPVSWLRSLVPDARFQLAAIVSGFPYGASRIYQRTPGDAATDGLPMVSAWDRDLQRWLHNTAPVADAAWRKAEGTLAVGNSTQPPTSQAVDARLADLPPGWYLLRAAIAGQGSRPTVSVGEGSTHVYVTGDLPPAVDVAFQLGTGPIHLLYEHRGGPLGINLFDVAGATIADVETFRVFGLDDFRAARERLAEVPLPPLSTWTPDTATGVMGEPVGAGLAVNGNNSAFGYQLVSPPIEVTPGAEVSVRLPLTPGVGRVCTGILNQERSTWLVRPMDGADVHRFASGPNANVFVVVANCQPPGTTTATRFAVAEGGYTPGRALWYVDELMRDWAGPPR